MLSALGWIPVIGPILQGLFTSASTIYSKMKDTQLGMRNAEVQEAQISAQIIHDTNDDICLRFLRDVSLVMPVAWGILIGWDTIIGARRANGTPWHPDLQDYMFHVGNYPDAVGYLPYVAFVFLFGCIGMNIWKRK